MKQLPAGCGYQGYEFGAGRYPDSECFGGRLYDMDNGEPGGILYEPSELIPCPMCHPRKAVDYWTEQNKHSGLSDIASRQAARALVKDIRNNRAKGTEPWRITFNVD